MGSERNQLIILVRISYLGIHRVWQLLDGGLIPDLIHLPGHKLALGNLGKDGLGVRQVEVLGVI